MERRNPLLVVLLVLVTFGIYGLVWLYRTTRELGDSTGRRMYPALDVILAILTLGAWGVWACFRNAEIVHDELQRAGVPHRDRSLPILVFGLGTYVAGLFAWLALTAILQDDLNQLADVVDLPPVEVPDEPPFDPSIDPLEARFAALEGPLARAS
ncbi:MAG: DUF4234 domain-containing protein [Myxococcales bacterium]|nr:DUF4234 domain-containing protein [Myxococcales bacterium]